MNTTATPVKRGAITSATVAKATFEQLLEELNIATTGARSVSRTTTRRRRYVDWAAKPRNHSAQLIVANELCRRITRGQVPVTASATLTWEIVTAIDPDSDAASRLVNHLLGQRATYGQTHAMLDYCSAYWPDGHRLVGTILDRLEALAQTDEERGAVTFLRISFRF